MNLRRFLSTCLLGLAVSVGWIGKAPAAPLDDLITAAKKEGVIDFYASLTLGPKGAQTLAEAFNKKYGLSVTLNYIPSTAMDKDVAKVISMAATGIAPESDLMVLLDNHIGNLSLRKLLEPFDYTKLGVAPNLIYNDSSTISIANQIVLPAYNAKILPAKDVPKKWEDLLDPKWKGGKLGMPSFAQHLARLAVGPWGEQKTTRFIKSLAKQELILGRLGEIYSRLLLGEILVAVILTDSFVHEAKQKGAPIVHAEVEPVISPAYHAGVLKRARHPNVGHLMALFMATSEGQQVWEKYQGQTSAFVPGTTAYKYVQGKQVLYMNQSELQTIIRLTEEYGKILGF